MVNLAFGYRQKDTFLIGACQIQIDLNRGCGYPGSGSGMVLLP